MAAILKEPEGKESDTEKKTKKPCSGAPLQAPVWQLPPIDSEEDSNELAGRMRHGDERAHEEFADYFGKSFRAYFSHAGMQWHEASDLAVTCIGNIALNIHKFEPTGRFRSWAWKFANHALSDWKRTRTVHTTLNDLAENVAATEIPEISMAIVRAVNVALVKLSLDEQKLIRMRYFVGSYSFREIAHELQSTEGAARTRHNRVLHKLAEILAKCPEIKGFVNRCEAKKATKTVSKQQFSKNEKKSINPN